MTPRQNTQRSLIGLVAACAAMAALPAASADPVSDYANSMVNGFVAPTVAHYEDTATSEAAYAASDVQDNLVTPTTQFVSEAAAPVTDTAQPYVQWATDNVGMEKEQVLDHGCVVLVCVGPVVPNPLPDPAQAAQALQDEAAVYGQWASDNVQMEKDQVLQHGCVVVLCVGPPPTPDSLQRDAEAEVVWAQAAAGGFTGFACDNYGACT